MRPESALVASSISVKYIVSAEDTEDESVFLLLSLYCAVVKI